MYKIWKKNQLVCVILLYNKTKSQKKDFFYYKLNYILKYFDTIKINSKKKNTIVIKVTKKYCLSNINRNIKSMK